MKLCLAGMTGNDDGTATRGSSEPGYESWHLGNGSTGAKSGPRQRPGPADKRPRPGSFLELLEFIPEDGGQFVVLLLERLGEAAAKLRLLAQRQLWNQRFPHRPEGLYFR